MLSTKLVPNFCCNSADFFSDGKIAEYMDEAIISNANGGC
ncbi:protein of unknown function [Shewanella benthica]|uniref:Uncharacterized protein n=1 Tax=Shewanella benthica TaxID=43661 RepID=A0A330LZ12_9GAMM|nr:protein of unknown function [Shewanella benthica]